ncbi:MAG: transposase [Desulfobacterales bacterium]|nr:transposase [Desulfobacterales bacterium]MBF0398527.1 transposase [Desulfobacterales bacterium]
MEKFQNKYRIPSARAKWCNYSGKGAYFITICTAGTEHLFGEIINNEMVLSKMGIIIQQEWNKSFEIRAELFCDIFVIMPNHIHAILRICVETHGCTSLRGCVSLPIRAQNHGIAFREPKSISSFIGGFKSAATKRINEFRNTPKIQVWQTRFHDHIIRDDDEYQYIKKYILENPMNWEQDKFFKKDNQ